MQLSDELARLFANIGRRLNRKQAEGLAPVDANVLFVLSAHPEGMRLQDLAALRGVDASTMSRRVASLIEADLVDKQVHPADARAHVLTLTTRGRGELNAERTRRARLITDSLEGWSAEDLDQLSSLLCRLNESLEAGHE